MVPTGKEKLIPINSHRKEDAKLEEEYQETSEQFSNEIDKTINELHVYQAELELQNEELRRVHKDLESSRNKYYDLFNHAPSGYFLLTSDLLIKEANIASLELSGLKRSEIADKPFIFLLRSKDRDRCMTYLREVQLNRQPDDIVVQIRRKDSQLRTIQLTGIPSSHSQDPRQLLLSASDLTELQQTQTALSETENLYRTLVNSSEDHVFMLSVDGYFFMSNSQTPYLNGAVERVVIGKHINDIFPGPHAALLIKNIHKVVMEREQVNFVGDLEHENTTYYLSYHLYPVFRNESLWAVGAICHDITAQKMVTLEKEVLEKQLRQAQKLESIGNLAGGIAHDFNNILSAILGYCELALEEVQPGTSLEEDLLEILNGGNRAKELVQQILTFARSSDKERTTITVTPIVEEAVKFIRSAIPANIEIHSSILGEAHILGDATELHQVIMNLLTNAAQAMEQDGGIIDIKVFETTDGQIDQSDNLVQISISDTGCGIDPDLLEKIYEPYFTTKSVGEGSGMGLAVTHGIITKYGGTIQVSSKPKHGTTFNILLPTIKQQTIEVPFKESTGVVKGKETILLVDDEPALIRMGKKTLEHLGYKVVSATSSFDALKIFKDNPEVFDLIISDVTMPGMTGEKLALEIMRITPDIPVILCTGYSRRISEEDIINLGIKALIFKPFVRKDLARVIRQTLDSYVPSAIGTF